MSFLAGGGSAQKKAAETFIIAILRHINKLTGSIPTFFIKEVWSHLVSSVYLNETLLIAVYESASQEEMQFIVNDLLHHTVCSVLLNLLIFSLASVHNVMIFFSLSTVAESIY